MANETDLDLIVLVVQFKDEKKTLEAVLAAGSPGVTYFYGRGTGVRQKLGFLGNLIEKEKVIFLTAVPSNKTAAVLEAASAAASLNQPGKGFACVFKLDRALGLLPA
jgi:nitrogen regulatory protein P-II 1